MAVMGSGSASGPTASRCCTATSRAGCSARSGRASTRTDVPITSVTNGVHAPTWTDPALVELASKRLGTTDTSASHWTSDKISNADIWAVRRQMKNHLVEDARKRLTAAWLEQNPGGSVPSWYSGILDPEVLTIGFARRVPTYKRLTLMLRDPERARSLLTHPTRPVQIVGRGQVASGRTTRASA